MLNATGFWDVEVAHTELASVVGVPSDGRPAGVQLLRSHTSQSRQVLHPFGHDR